MADAYSRRDSWIDYLPGNLQQSINTNPLLNALGRAMNRRPADIEGASKRIFAQPGDREMDDRAWLLQQAQPQRRLNPLAVEMLDKGGLLANFLGPGARMPQMPLKEMIGYRGLRRSPAEPTFDKPVHQRTLEEDGFGIWHGTTPDVANSYAMTSMINNTPERQAMEAARKLRFKKDFGTKRWDGDLEYLIASEMDQKAGRTHFASDGSNVAKHRLLFRNPLILDFDGKNFNSWRDFNTNIAARIARERGHDALIARNVVDYGDLGYLPPWAEGRPATSVAVFDRNQIAPFWQSQRAEPFDPMTAEALNIGKFLEAVRK